MGRVKFTRDTTQLKSICFSLAVINGEHRRILLAHASTVSARNSRVIFPLQSSVGFQLLQLSFGCLKRYSSLSLSLQ
jgi:hypothetical protein